jgi:arabinogalactan endo-1,4-beta-galactosidase
MLSITSLAILLFLSSCKKDEPAPAMPLISVFNPTQGIVGTAVTISGANFGSSQGSSVVMFNGVAATIKSYAPTILQVTVPPGATTGPVSITIGDLTTSSEENFTVVPAVADDPNFYFGSDLSYVNQILDHGGQYKDNNVVKDPYQIFKDHGNDLVRLRVWHNPQWTKEVYTPDGSQLYNDMVDVAKAIASSKQHGMKVLLDFHYSDRWTDPGAQEIPAAWKDIKAIDVLEDSVYNYTLKTLKYLEVRGLMPEFVQIGNETNCGMLYEFNETPVDGFPSCNGCNGQWTNLRTVINSGIQAVRDVSATSAIKTKILLHVADPVNIDWWFDNVMSGGTVHDFDIIGFSYYPIWHTGVSIAQLSDRVAGFKTKYNKDLIILETAYPWTTAGSDGYANLFGSQPPVTGFPYTQQGQFDMMKAITQEIIDGGGIGIVYWEPAWISADIRDLWNAGSSWENCTFFDFNGNVIKGMDYMKSAYDR